MLYSRIFKFFIRKRGLGCQQTSLSSQLIDEFLGDSFKVLFGHFGQGILTYICLIDMNI